MQRASALLRLPGEEMGRSTPSSGTLDASLQLPDTAFEPHNWRRRLFLYWGGLFPLSLRHTTLPAIHRQVLVWQLEDLVLWFVETERIKTFRPRRN